MDNIYNGVFTVLRSALFFEELPPEVLNNGEEITAELNNHCVTPLAGAIPLLPAGKTPDAWRGIFAFRIVAFKKILAAETELYDILSAAGIGLLFLREPRLLDIILSLMLECRVTLIFLSKKESLKRRFRFLSSMGLP